MRPVPLLALLAPLALGVPGCASDAMSPSDDPADPQLPPRGAAAFAWLAAGHYQAWRCEPAPHAPRAPSPHGSTRICVNDALTAAAASAQPFPAGASSVKEVYSGTAITQYAIARKLRDGSGGATWYWFEGTPDQVAASGEGIPGCTGCHGQAPHDFAFTVVP